MHGLEETTMDINYWNMLGVTINKGLEGLPLLWDAQDCMTWIETEVKQPILKWPHPWPRLVEEQSR